MSGLGQYAKFFAGLAGVLAQVIAANVVTGSALHYCQVALAALTALSVFIVPNAPAPPAPPAAPNAAPAP
jgi:hypothetical protein